VALEKGAHLGKLISMQDFKSRLPTDCLLKVLDKEFWLVQ
jgi:hypothetical protein